jgi:hypothetical protein
VGVRPIRRQVRGLIPSPFPATGFIVFSFLVTPCMP